MNQGSLADYFEGVGAKNLSSTEVNFEVSRGHELQGISDFRAFLGSPDDKARLDVTYVWLPDDEPPIRLDLSGSWYNSRKAQKDREPEYRLYYPKAAEDVVYRAKADDTLFLCKPHEGPLLAIFCEQGSTTEQQLLWLFGLRPASDHMIQQRRLGEGANDALNLAGRYVLELLGIEVDVTEEAWLGRLVDRFGSGFPSTATFSAFARDAVQGVDPVAAPDVALLEWMDFEERLFRTFERHLLAERLAGGFFSDGLPDVDAFVQFSLSVQNRRKSRAGYAFGHNTEAILAANSLIYKREATTEKKRGPDFLFPGEAAYARPGAGYPDVMMLGAKTSCKDRWRQVLAEADKISPKHLLTIEPGISEAQTTEMQAAGLRLVVPGPLHSTYRVSQLSYLIDLQGFIELVKGQASPR